MSDYVDSDSDERKYSSGEQEEMDKMETFRSNSNKIFSN